MNHRTEMVNKRAVTTVHKITPEEEELYTCPRYQYTEFLDKFKTLKGGENV